MGPHGARLEGPRWEQLGVPRRGNPAREDGVGPDPGRGSSGCAVGLWDGGRARQPPRGMGDAPSLEAWQAAREVFWGDGCSGAGSGSVGPAPQCGPGLCGGWWVGSPARGHLGSVQGPQCHSPPQPAVFARRLCRLIFKDSSKNRSRGFVTVPTSAFDSEQTPHTPLAAEIPPVVKWVQLSCRINLKGSGSILPCRVHPSFPFPYTHTVNESS